MESGKFGYRDRLPATSDACSDGTSLWSFLKHAIGKDLSKITMPIQFNEPLSFLQRLTEHMEYSDLLNLANSSDDPLERMQYVAAFAVSGLASNWLRLGKPFNPLLGETYQLKHADYRMLCEQVSHHPPISAFHAESPDYTFFGSVHPKIKFCGKSIEIHPKGTLNLNLTRWNELYSWSNVNCCVHNVIVGKLWIEQHGTMEIVNHNNGYRCELVFKESGWFSKDLHRIEGFIYDQKKTRKAFLYGKWTENLKYVDIHAYDEHSKTNGHAAGHSEASKDVAQNTPRKMLAKLNSLSLGSFRQSTDQGNGSVHEDDDDSLKSHEGTSVDIPNSKVLWTALARPAHSPEYFNFTSYAMMLNEMPADQASICPTDSRLRPDIRLMEQGHIDKAAKEKARLEEKQRDARKNNKGQGIFEPRWFSYKTHPVSKAEGWMYDGGFWGTESHDKVDIF